MHPSARFFLGLFSAVLCFAPGGVWAKVVPAPIFSDNMVLQRGTKVPIWGKAAPGETVTVKFAGQTKSVRAGENGDWKLSLDPLETSAENRTMVICGADDQVDIANVLVGEVWLCSGQSNMEMPLWLDNNPRFRQYTGDKLAAATDYPLIRFVRTPRTYSMVPDRSLAVTWAPMRSDNIRPFSAVAYFFGVGLFKELNVPIGLIQSAWGGTDIEAWISLDGFHSALPDSRFESAIVESRTPGHPRCKNLMAHFRKEMEAWQNKFEEALRKNDVPPPLPHFPSAFVRPGKRPNMPGILYNRMIVGYAPFAMRGAIWYQGCNNVSDGSLYLWKLRALHTGWKKAFENPHFRLYIVQLAPYIYGRKNREDLPRLCEAQQIYADSEADAALVTIGDVGNLHDIHPADKSQVGHRLVLQALKRDYGRDVKSESPRLRECRCEPGKLVLAFDNVGSWRKIGEGEDANFEIADLGGGFRPASVRIVGDKLEVSSPKVPAPRAVRYMWRHDRTASLANVAGLPLGPFRHDTRSDREKAAAFGRRGRAVYEYDLLAGGANGPAVKINNADRAGKFKRIHYMLELTHKNGKFEYVFISIPKFTDNARFIGLPETNYQQQRHIEGIWLHSNVLQLDHQPYVGIIEITSGNYRPRNTHGIRGASNELHDIGDELLTGIGYGCFQIHDRNYRQTIFAINNWRNPNRMDIGIGNNPDMTRGQHPDWTFSRNAGKYSSAVFRVAVE
ncbi:MAG: hypothetical protein IJJ28_04045 [Lentisphaeria bacterium]|nr:hypothetical protein [Lentisphaeria bacterium]